MSAVSAIVLPDAQATPVNHTFIPLGPDAKNVWWFEDQLASAASPIGYQRLSLSLTRPSNPAPGASSQERVSRVKMTIHLPRLETLSSNAAGFTPSPTVAYVPRMTVEFILPERSVLQDRKDLRKYITGLLGNQQVIDAIESLQNVY